MGEAKRRKQSDPYYGTSKPVTVRGLIISAPMTVVDGELRVGYTGLNQQELRASLLYWDRLSMPTSNMINIGPEEDVKYLISAGIMETPRLSLSGQIGAELAKLPSMALVAYEAGDPGKWSLGGGENSILVQGGAALPEGGTSIMLYNALPTPGLDVPLAEILNFKQKRRDELLALRQHIDSLNEEIQSSADSTESLQLKLLELDQACANLAAVCKEWQLPFHLTNLQASLNFDIKKAGTTAVRVWTETETLELPATARIISSGSAALMSQIKLTAGIHFQPVKRKKSPFKYVYEAQKYLL